MSKPLDHIRGKAMDWPAASRRVKAWQSQGQVVVFTNGCFDLLHYGHVHYLAEAAGLGDRLVIGLNSDASVRRLKGDHRPIQDQHSRQLVLAALAAVDGVVLFEQDTPRELIRTLSPDVLVKGGDYRPEEVAGVDWVLQQGGSVRIFSFVEGYSTSCIEEKIRRHAG
jgi:rfaE bifunctional protein nucleotidyltransferase chain/domain